MKKIISVLLIVIILSLTIIPCFAVAPSVPIVTDADIGLIGAIADSIGIKVTAGDAKAFWKEKIEEFEDVSSGFLDDLKKVAIKNWSIILNSQTEQGIKAFFEYLQTEEDFETSIDKNIGGMTKITNLHVPYYGPSGGNDFTFSTSVYIIVFKDTVGTLVLGFFNDEVFTRNNGGFSPSKNGVYYGTYTYSINSYTDYLVSELEKQGCIYVGTVDVHNGDQRSNYVVSYGQNYFGLDKLTIQVSDAYSSSSPYGEAGIGYDYQINIRNLFPDESIDNYETKDEKLNYLADKVYNYSISVEGQKYYEGTNIPAESVNWSPDLDSDFVYTDDFDTSVSIDTPIEDITVIDPFTGITTPVEGGFKFTDLFSKFHFIIQIKEIIENLFNDITASQRQPPSMMIDFSDSEESYLSNLGQHSVFNLNWYAKYKPYVDSILSGILWIFFLWHVYKSIPAYFGSERITEENEARGLLRKGGE